MKKVIRLTERDLTRLVKRIIKESDVLNMDPDEFSKHMSDYDINEVLDQQVEEAIEFLNDYDFNVSSDSPEDVIDSLRDFHNETDNRRAGVHAWTLSMRIENSLDERNSM